MLPGFRSSLRSSSVSLTLAIFILLFLGSRVGARTLQKPEHERYYSDKVTTCSTVWLQNQETIINRSLNKTRDLVSAAVKKAIGTQFSGVRNTLARALDQIYNAGLFLNSGDFTKARKRVEALRTSLQTCQTLVASVSKGASWSELSQSLTTTRLIPSQLLTISKTCKNSGSTVTPITPPPPSIPTSNSTKSPPPASTPKTSPPPKNISSPILPTVSPPPPSPPPPTSTKSDVDGNSTVLDADINYEAYGWKPYGKDGGNWSKIIYATNYGNNQGSDTYGQCYGNTPTDISAQYLGVFNTAGSKVLLQLGAECGACYQIKCVELKYCITQSPVTVRLTNSCPKSAGKGHPWCDFPRIHFDMSKPAFSAMADPDVGAVQVRYRRVDCPVVGDVAYHISSKGHKWWIPINILNVGGAGAVSDMWFRTSNTSNWIPIQRSWGANWPIHQKPYLVGKSVSFRLKLRGNEEQYVVSENVLPSNWTFGKTYVGGQFERGRSDLITAAGPSGSDVSF